MFLWQQSTFEQKKKINFLGISNRWNDLELIYAFIVNSEIDKNEDYFKIKT